MAVCLLWGVACGPSTQPEHDAATSDASRFADAGDDNDRDGDGVPNDLDACPDDAQQWSDRDGDGHCDELDDHCPDDVSQWSDADHDGYCDEIDDDCPNNPDGFRDSNGDGVCDDQDDSDGDSVSDGEEREYGADCAISNPLIADTDGDGLEDNEDPFPRDPFPEYILFRNDQGTIDLALSNRDGTFETPEAIGAPNGCTPQSGWNCGNLDYQYTAFVISDFDNNGSMDFLAVGDASTVNPANDRELWWFFRSRDISTGSATMFEQRLVDTGLDVNLFGITADFNNDNRIDLATMSRNSGGYITWAELHSYENTGLVTTANCAYTEDVNNPGGCAFIRRLAVDLTPRAQNQWSARVSSTGVDVDGDGNRDLVLFTQSSGGNVPAPVYLLAGNGDTTFQLPTTALFSHNSGSCGESPANMVLFGDFDGDQLGDVIMGLDDDGDAGSAWFYPGTVNGGSFDFDFTSCIESFDLNPGAETGQEHYGQCTRAHPFDFDFDGYLDVMVGYNYTAPWTPPSRTAILMGAGDGTAGPVTPIRESPDSLGLAFYAPHRLCTWFPISSP